MSSGLLRIQSFTMRLTGPVPFVDIFVEGSGFSTQFTTDGEGNAPDLTVPAPDAIYSLEEENTTNRPYATYTLTASKPGWQTLTIRDLQVFSGQITLAQLELTPAGSGGIPDVETIDVPEHALFAGNGGSGSAPAPSEIEEGDWILNEVVIPERITVHLGRPAVSATNVTVSFRHYIANVASSEVYPTWPTEALKANIHAQISLALNRIYTEWYPSKGYSYNITNSTSYDQYFVYGRTIFDVMQKLTDEIFNTYLKRSGRKEPFYSEYCDGKSVSCPGMKQWGTVTLANQGMTALQILRYYYGSDLSIVTTNNIAAIPQSYPGSSLRRGDSGTNVSILQRQLNRITQDYPSFGTLAVDGVFGAAMENTVKRFQRQFSLTADGVVGKSTWYKISFIYASVLRLAELTSEGDPDTTLSGGKYPGTPQRLGSTGTAVEQLQFWLNILAQFNADIPTLTVDGSFGANTVASVRAFQTQNNLVADGVVGSATWDALYKAYLAAQEDINRNAYPGMPLRTGSSGSNVKLLQFWLSVAGSFYAQLDNVTVDGVFGKATARAVEDFQDFFGLTADGIVGETTWNRLYRVYVSIANQLLSPGARPGVYPGTLRTGSSGASVRELQYYLYLISAYYPTLPAVTIDGEFGSATTAAVTAWQRLNSLTADGIVGQSTWNSLVRQAERLRTLPAGPQLNRVPYPGEPLTVGSTGAAVTYATQLLQGVAFWLPEVESYDVRNDYNTEIADSVSSFQRAVGLEETGILNEAAWQTLEMVYVSFLGQEE